MTLNKRLYDLVIFVLDTKITVCKILLSFTKSDMTSKRRLGLLRFIKYLEGAKLQVRWRTDIKYLLKTLKTVHPDYQKLLRGL